MKAKSIILRLRSLPSRRASRFLLRSMVACESLWQCFDRQPEATVRSREFRNKWRAFLAFEYADLHLLSGRVQLSLPELICKVEKCPVSAFAIEGIGYHLTKSKVAQAGIAANLTPFNFAELTSRTLVLLHAGFGLAMAESVLHEMNRKPCDHALLLGSFAERCRRCCQPGYAGVAFEALGFAARMLYPHLITQIDHSLSGQPAKLAYFWHGVGRGIYFAPEYVSAACSAPWKSLAACLQEPPHDTARQNATAGFAWAITIINMDTPEVMQTFARHHCHLVLEDPAFIDGAGAAAGFWKHVSQPEHLDPEALFRYRMLAESI